MGLLGKDMAELYDMFQSGAIGFTDGDMFGLGVGGAGGAHAVSTTMVAGLLDAFHIADAADAANGGENALQLFLVFDVEEDVDDGAAVAALFIGLGFE